MLRRLIGLSAVLVICAGVIAGCGGGGSDTTGDDTSATADSTSGDAGGSSGDMTVKAYEPGLEDIVVPASFKGCKEARGGYVIGQEMIQQAENEIETGEGVKAAERLRQTGEEMTENAEELCVTESKLSASEEEICANTPQQLAEALEIEDTPANREYIEVYEVTCERKVPLP